MNGNQPYTGSTSSGSRKKWVWILILIVVAAGLAVYFYGGSVAPLPGAEEPSGQIPATESDSTAGGNVPPATGGDAEVSAIEQELDATGVDDLDAELSDIDKELAQ